MYECEMCMGHPFDASSFRVQSMTKSTEAINNITAQLTVAPHTTISPLNETETNTLGKISKLHIEKIPSNSDWKYEQKLSVLSAF